MDKRRKTTNNEILNNINKTQMNKTKIEKKENKEFQKYINTICEKKSKVKYLTEKINRKTSTKPEYINKLTRCEANNIMTYS